MVTELNVARAKYQQKLYDQAVADLESAVQRHTTSPSAPDAYLLMGTIYEQQGKYDDAMASYIELRDRFKADIPHAAEALYRLAAATLQSKRKDRVDSARASYAAIIAEYGDTSWAPRALGAKAGLEERERIKEMDSTVSAVAPAALASYRTLVTRYPDVAGVDIALQKMGDMYDDLKRYDLAVKAFEDLVAKYPTAASEAWWRIGELYDRRLKDPAKAKAAYAQVPATSSHYRDAQRRLTAK